MMQPISPEHLVDVELVELGPIADTALGRRLVDALVDAMNATPAPTQEGVA